MPNLSLDTERHHKNWRSKMNVLTTLILTLGAIIGLLMALSVVDGSLENDRKNADEKVTLHSTSEKLRISRRSLMSSTGNDTTLTNNSSVSLIRQTSRLQISPTLKTTDRNKGCFNTTVIASKVSQSQLIFAGKVINITETIINRQISPPAQSSSPNPNNGYFYYDFNRKRRRESRGQRFGGNGSVKRTMMNNVTISHVIVHVKTVFKGPTSGLEGTLVMLTIEPGGDGSKEARSMSRCLRKLRTLDTRVFFYKTGRRNSNNNDEEVDDEILLKLTNQSFVPLPPTLHVLAAVRSAVKGW
jgi:hypothetical protein